MRELDSHQDVELATEWIDHLIEDMADRTWPMEVHLLARTLARSPSGSTRSSRGTRRTSPTGRPSDDLIKRVKRVAFGFTSFRSYRVRSLLYAGKPDWTLLATITPAEIRRARKVAEPTGA